MISAENCDEFLAKIAVAPYVGAWIETGTERCVCALVIVAPYVGAWIETDVWCDCQNALQSLPTWERGLKQRELESISNPATVAPYVGAWIETTIFFTAKVLV